MRGRASVLRFALLAAFLVAVAATLWGLDFGWEVVLPVMAVAWLIAAGFEWLAWTEEGSLRALPRRNRHVPLPAAARDGDTGEASLGGDAREEAAAPETAAKPKKTAASKTKKAATAAKPKKPAAAKRKKPASARAKKRPTQDGRG